MCMLGAWGRVSACNRLRLRGWALRSESGFATTSREKDTAEEGAGLSKGLGLRTGGTNRENDSHKTQQRVK